MKTNSGPCSQSDEWLPHDGHPPMSQRILMGEVSPYGDWIELPRYGKVWRSCRPSIPS